MKHTFKCNACNNEVEHYDGCFVTNPVGVEPKVCPFITGEICNWEDVTPQLGEAELPAYDNTGSPKLPADIVDLLNRCRKALSPYFKDDTLLMEDLDHIIGGQLRAGA